MEPIRNVAEEWSQRDELLSCVPLNFVSVLQQLPLAEDSKKQSS